MGCVGLCEQWNKERIRALRMGDESATMPPSAQRDVVEDAALDAFRTCGALETQLMSTTAGDTLGVLGKLRVAVQNQEDAEELNPNWCLVQSALQDLEMITRCPSAPTREPATPYIGH